jgi:hypothetical protein
VTGPNIPWGLIGIGVALLLAGTIVVIATSRRRVFTE